MNYRATSAYLLQVNLVSIWFPRDFIRPQKRSQLKCVDDTKKVVGLQWTRVAPDKAQVHGACTEGGLLMPCNGLILFML